MALKQPNSAVVYPEPQGSTAARGVSPVNLELNALGGLTPTVSGALDARLLANGLGGVTVTDGGDNPSALSELRLAVAGSRIITYD